jgi:hypothetical protein
VHPELRNFNALSVSFMQDLMLSEVSCLQCCESADIPLSVTEEHPSICKVLSDLQDLAIAAIT